MHAAADHVLEGAIKLGGQEHFYLEPNGAIVVPTESDEYLLISSTQAPNKHQVCRTDTLQYFYDCTCDCTCENAGSLTSAYRQPDISTHGDLSGLLLI
jgi:xanthine dehydrogenase molybdopterin-binding subunit B